MPVITWNDKMTVGVEAIDSDHRKLIDMLNLLNDEVKDRADVDVIRRILDELINYTEYHFECEERLMKMARYPDRDSHLKLHRDLTEKARKLRDNFLDNPNQQSGYKLLDFMSEWLMRHILREDMKLGAVLDRKAAAEKK